MTQEVDSTKDFTLPCMNQCIHLNGCHGDIGLKMKLCVGYNMCKFGVTLYIQSNPVILYNVAMQNRCRNFGTGSTVATQGLLIAH